MTFSETAPLIAVLKLDDKFSGPLKNAQGALGKFDARLDKTGTRAFQAGQQIGTGIKNGLKIGAVGLGLLATQVIAGLDSLVKLEKATAQTEAVIKSTGGAADISAGQVRTLAEKYEALNAIVGDEFIQTGENLLLTFTNIKKDAFEPALATALDMNTALGKGPEGLTDTVRILGKALNDPAKGLTALQRIGIRFTDDQKKQITAALKANDTFKAQDIILTELNRRFGGSFIAQGGTTGGKVAKFTDSIEDLQRALATALLPTVGKVADKLSVFLADPKVVTGISDLGTSIAGLFTDKNLTAGADALKGLFQIAKDAAPALQSAAEITGKVVGTAVGIFKSLPPEIQALAVAGLAINKLTGGLVTNIAGGLISAVLKQLVSGVVNVTGATVIVNGGVGPGTVPGSGGAGLLGLLGPAAIAALGAEFATQMANQDLASKGITQKFQTPGSGILPFGIESSLNNIGTAIGIIGGRKDTPPATARDVRAAAASETRNSLRQEQAIMRNARIAAGASRAAARSMVGAVKEQDTTVKVNVPVTVKQYINGRLIEAATGRFTSTIVGSRGAFREFG